MKVENMVAAAAGGGGGANRPASGPPSGQGYSKYQKSLPPRFQRQQQVSVFLLLFIYWSATSMDHCLLLRPFKMQI